MKKSTVIAIFALIAALIVVYAIQKVGKNLHTPPPGGGFVKILPKDMRAADIHKIEIYPGDAKKDAIVLSRTEEGWSVPSRFNSKGNEKNISDLLDEIKKVEGELRTKKKSLHELFGITDKKAVHISLYDSRGKLYRELLLGKKGERWNEGFVRLAGSNSVYLADKNLLSTLGIYSEGGKPDPKKWLHLKIVDKQSEQVAKLVLDMPDKHLVLQKKEKKKEGKEEKQAQETKKPTPPEQKKEEKKEYEWVLAKPQIEFKLKDWAVKSLVKSACQLTGVDVADPAKTEQYGFDSPTYTATLTMDDKTTETLLVGKKAEHDQDKRYAKLKDAKTVYLVPKYTIEGVFKKMRDLVDIKIWDIKKEDVTSLNLHRPEYEILLQRQRKHGTEAKKPEDYKWVLARPKTRFMLKDFKVTSILSKLTKPSPDDLFVSGDLTGYGLAAPQFKATFKMKDGSTHALSFGKKLPDSDDRYVKFQGKDHVYSLSKYNFQELFPKLPDLLTIQIMQDLRKGEIASLDYHTPQGDFALARTQGAQPPEKKWSIKIDKKESDAKSAIVERILDAITGIKPQDMAVGKSDADCALDKPTSTLTISTQKSPHRYTLLFGEKVSRDTPDRYFKIKGQPEIFVLSNADFGEIFRKVQDLQVKKPPQPKKEKKPPEKKKAVPSLKKTPAPLIPKKAATPGEKTPPPEKKPKESSQKKEQKAKPAAPQGVPQEKKENKPASPEKEKPAAHPPVSNAFLKKAKEHIPPPPFPEFPAPEKPLPLPPKQPSD